MATTEIWRVRALAWKESGQRSKDFALEHGLDAGELRSWTSKLGLSKRRKPGRLKAMDMLPRLVRVIPRPSNNDVSAVVVRKPTVKAGVRVRVGAMRIEVGVGFDGGTLRSVLQIAHEVRR
jgi:hypothetical protein